VYAWMSKGSVNGEGLKEASYFLKLGMPFLIITAILGGYFFFSLQTASPYIFAAITGNMTIAQYNFLPAFLLYPILILIAGGSALGMYKSAKQGKFSRPVSLALVIAAFLMVPLAEAVDDAARAPYMVIAGGAGLPANVFANTMIPISWMIAELAVTIAVVVMATFLLGIYFIYRVKTSPITEEPL